MTLVIIIIIYILLSVSCDLSSYKSRRQQRPFSALTRIVPSEPASQPEPILFLYRDEPIWLIYAMIIDP